jgi:hypothetical protein
VVFTTASVGASIAASGTSLTETSFGPSYTTARTVCSFRGSVDNSGIATDDRRAKHLTLGAQWRTGVQQAR